MSLQEKSRDFSTKGPHSVSSRYITWVLRRPPGQLPSAEGAAEGDHLVKGGPIFERANNLLEPIRGGWQGSEAALSCISLTAVSTASKRSSSWVYVIIPVCPYPVSPIGLPS